MAKRMVAAAPNHFIIDQTGSSSNSLTPEIDEALRHGPQEPPGRLVAPGRLGIIEVGVEQHVRRAHGLELPEVAAHLLDAALARAARVFRHRPVRELQLDPRAERGHRPVLLLGDLLEPGQPCIPQPVHAHPDRVPGVAMKHRAPERTLAGPARPTPIPQMKRPPESWATTAGARAVSSG